MRTYAPATHQVKTDALGADNYAPFMRRTMRHRFVSARSGCLPRFNDWDAFCDAREARGRIRGRQTMDPKLTLLFVLIGAIIALSHVGRDGVGHPRLSAVTADMRERDDGSD